MGSWIFVFSAVFLGVCGQLLMKKGMLIVGSINALSINTILHALFNPFVFCGFLVYGISSILWLVAISRLPLSTAYPILSLGYVFVVFVSFLLFKEPLTIAKIIGVLLICTGVIFVGRS